MPLATDPNQIARVVLDVDADKPEASRPTFKYRHFTDRQRLHREEAINAFEACRGSNTERVALLDVAIEIGFAGWENLPIPSGDIAGLNAGDGMLTADEKIELFYKAGEAARLSEDSKKKSGWPFTSVPASSATDAEKLAGA